MTPDEFIRIFPAFRRGSRPLVRDLLSSGRERLVPADTRLYAEGDVCQGIAFVLSGEVRVFKIGATGREITLYEIGSGETCILNASCILGGTVYPANAVTTADTSVFLVPSPVFSRLVAEHEEMREFVFALLSRRISSVMELVEEVAFGRMDGRLMAYLAEKADRGRLDTTHQRIANDLGTSREVVSRLLKDFERGGKVSLSRNLITLLKA